ncbi:MAG: DUF4388 domain-containing protein [Thermoanaerobaculia bacterium]
MSISGKFSTMSMADLIQWARTAQRTGILKLSDDAKKEVQVTFKDGRIVYSRTNDPREKVGPYLLHRGLCNEADIEEAMAIQRTTGSMLASILVHAGRMTEKQAIDVLSEKTVEDLCDIFLWSDGTFLFEPKPAAPGVALRINLDPIQVVVEGVRRAEIWNRLTAFIHRNSFYESTDNPIDETLAFEDLAMAKRVYGLLDGNVAVGEVVEKLPFSRYKIYRAISELLEKGLVRQSEVTGVVDRQKRVQHKLEDSRAAAGSGRYTEAMEILRGLADANPGRQDILEDLVSVTDDFRRAIYEHNFTLEDVPVITISPDSIPTMNMGPADAFLLSRIDGRMTVRAILKISPVSEFDGLRSFKRLLNAKVIDFPHRRLPVENVREKATK